MKRWFQKRSKPNLFDLLNDDVLAQGDEQTIEQQANLGRLQALSKQDLVEQIREYERQLKLLKRELAQQLKEAAKQKTLISQLSSASRETERLSKQHKHREKTSQYERDQFQIQMRQLSLRVSELETQLLRSQRDNAELNRRLAQTRSKPQC